MVSSDSRVAMIAFTGSQAVGLGINECCAKSKGEHEAGGGGDGRKNAIVVDEDARTWMRRWRGGGQRV